MAELLYRLGTFSARRAGVVIVAWLIVLAIAAGGFLVGFKGLTSSFDVPGTASGAVIDDLSARLPDFSGASGTVVFTTADGSKLTATQQGQISNLVTGAKKLKDVANVIDPFATEAQRADQLARLESGRKQIADGRTQLDAGQAQLDAGSAQLAASQAALTAGTQQAEAAGAPAQQLAALDAQQQQLDAGFAQLADQQAVIDSSRADLEAQSTKAERGAELADLSSGISLVSDDGSTALVRVSFSEPRLTLPEESKQGVIDYFQSEPVDGADVSFSTDIAQGVPKIFGVGEVIGVVVAAVVLLVMLGSIIAGALPLVTALVGVAIGALTTLAFSGVVSMASVTPVLGVMLGLAVGIDYTLFVVNRHRKQLRQGLEVLDSIGIANGTAGNAVVFAGSTVIVALLALNVTGIPFLGLMGSSGALSVAVAVLIAITLTPALLGLLGERVLSKRVRSRLGRSHVQLQKAVKAMSTVRAIVTVLVAVAAMLTIAIPALSMRLGLPDGSAEASDSLSYQAFTTTEQQFGAGATGPLLVTADLPAGLDDDSVLAAQVAVAKSISELDDVTAVAPVAVSDDNRLTAFQVIPAEGPNSVSTEQLVRDLRIMPPIDGDITLGVAGQAAINIDISEGLSGILPIYLLVVVGLSLLIMALVFRSILVPLIATGGFILSLFATYGATVAIFQWGWFADVLGISPGPILSFLPVILVGILFGLAMDYQLFLASGMREAYVHGAPARLAVMQGFRAGRSVVIAAALIMVSVFGGFVFSEAIIIRAIGFGLAFGVLLDAFVIRLLVMPAIMHLLGRSAWWFPRFLDKILPDVDVEGAALERKHHAPEPAAELQTDSQAT